MRTTEQPPTSPVAVMLGIAGVVSLVGTLLACLNAESGVAVYLFVSGTIGALVVFALSSLCQNAANAVWHAERAAEYTRRTFQELEAMNLGAAERRKQRERAARHNAPPEIA